MKILIALILATLVIPSIAHAENGIVTNTTAMCAYKSDLEQAIANQYIDPSNSSCLVAQKGTYIYVDSCPFFSGYCEVHIIDEVSPGDWQIINPQDPPMWMSAFDIKFGVSPPKHRKT